MGNSEINRTEGSKNCPPINKKNKAPSPQSAARSSPLPISGDEYVRTSAQPSAAPSGSDAVKHLNLRPKLDACCRPIPNKYTRDGYTGTYTLEKDGSIYFDGGFNNKTKAVLSPQKYVNGQWCKDFTKKENYLRKALAETDVNKRPSTLAFLGSSVQPKTISLKGSKLDLEIKKDPKFANNSIADKLKISGITVPEELSVEVIGQQILVTNKSNKGFNGYKAGDKIHNGAAFIIGFGFATTRGNKWEVYSNLFSGDNLKSVSSQWMGGSESTAERINSLLTDMAKMARAANEGTSAVLPIQPPTQSPPAKPTTKISRDDLFKQAEKYKERFRFRTGGDLAKIVKAEGLGSPVCDALQAAEYHIHEMERDKDNASLVKRLDTIVDRFTKALESSKKQDPIDNERIKLLEQCVEDFKGLRKSFTEP